MTETPRRKPVDPERYDGEGSAWEVYLLKFELTADWNRWGEGERAEALLMSLDGDAAGYVQELRGFRHFSYEEICATLNDRFGAACTVAADKLALRSLKKKEPEESYAHLAQDIQRLARRVYRGATRLAEEEARDTFL